MDQCIRKHSTTISRNLGLSSPNEIVYANIDNNLKELGVVESKRNSIRKGLVHKLLNAQDTVLCSYFAQRSGERDASRSGARNVEEAFQGLDSFI